MERGRTRQSVTLPARGVQVGAWRAAQVAPLLRAGTRESRTSLRSSALQPYKALRCPTGKTRQPWVNARRRKYSTLPKFGNIVCVAATRPKEEGRIAIVTNAGRAAVDADGIGAKGFAGRATVSRAVAHTTGAIGVRQNRVVLTPGVCTPSVAVMCMLNRARASAIRKATGAIVQRSPRRVRHKPFKPLRREGRMFGSTCMPLCSFS